MSYDLKRNIGLKPTNRPLVAAFRFPLLRASNKTLLPNVGTTSGQSLNGIRAVRFLDQVEHGAESVKLAMTYAGKFMRWSRS